MTHPEEERRETKPVRLRLSRRKGFNLQELSRSVNGLEAVKVTRPGEFGSRFAVGFNRIPEEQWFVQDRMSGAREWFDKKDSALEFAGFQFREWAFSATDGAKKMRRRAKERLAGKNVACFCPPGAAFCHGLVLLEIANAKEK